MGGLKPWEARQFLWVYARHWEREKQILSVVQSPYLWWVSPVESQAVGNVRDFSFFWKWGRPPLKQDDFRVRACGERNGAGGGWGSLCVCSGGPHKASWKTLHHAPQERCQLLLLSLGWRTLLPTSHRLGVHYSVFSLCSSAKSPALLFPCDSTSLQVSSHSSPLGS